MRDLREVVSWVGSRVDDVHGRGLGTLQAVFAHRERGIAQWLLVRSGTLRVAHIAVPAEGATGGGGHMWVPLRRDDVATAPHVLVDRPMSPQLELECCRHYGLALTPGARSAEWERRSALIALVRVEDIGALDAGDALGEGRERRRDRRGQEPAPPVAPPSQPPPRQRTPPPRHRAPTRRPDVR